MTGDLNGVWKKAIEGLNARHQEQETRWNKLQDIAETDWLVPLSVRSVIDGIKVRLAPIRVLLN